MNDCCKDKPKKDWCFSCVGEKEDQKLDTPEEKGDDKE